DPGGLNGVAPTPDTQVEIRFGQLKVPEECVRHPGVVMLSGVHQDPLMAPCLEGAQDRRDLHEVWSRAGNDEDTHQLASADAGACDPPGFCTCPDSPTTRAPPSSMPRMTPRVSMTSRADRATRS